MSLGYERLQAAGLIDHYTLLIHPPTLGSGAWLFGGPCPADRVRPHRNRHHRQGRDHRALRAPMLTLPWKLRLLNAHRNVRGYERLPQHSEAHLPWSLIALMTKRPTFKNLVENCSRKSKTTG
ncbi:hypothetical protein OHU25_49595 [Streptomyces sp. NBC_00117]|uniref:hypothetical protein n=1 Tax=Streptomyces sp. NBC_00117 TaxID=2975657 RepID=UPI0032560911